MTRSIANTTGRHKCRHKFCPHFYDDVIAKEGWGGGMKGAECIPCLYALQMLDQGQTPEQVEAVPQLMESFVKLLGKTGWTWQHVKDSYERAKAAPMAERLA